MKWNYTNRKIDELKPQSKNPRRISKKMQQRLKKSLEEDGDMGVIVINADGTIIGGHQRYKLFKEAGIEMVDCKQASEQLSQKEVDRRTLSLNKISGETDFYLLANGYDIEDVLYSGFDQEELHIDNIPDEKEKTKVCQLIVKFENEDDLRQAEVQIAAIIDLYASASYKVKVK